MDSYKMPESMITDFWNRSKILLKQKGKTQIDFCNDNHINLQSFRNKISTNTQPTVGDVMLLSEYLNVSIDFLITGKQKEKDQVDLDKVREALQVALDMINK